MNTELLDLINKTIDLAKDNQDLLAKLNEAKQALEKPIVKAQEVLPINKLSSEAQALFNMLQSSEWPEAVPEFLICSETEEDKCERAEGILDYIDIELKDKKVLDFGCGEGHVSLKAAETSALSVGYDVKPSGAMTWEQKDKYLLTTDFSKVQNQGPYDLVILYDVLDHSEDPVAILKQVKSVCHSGSQIFVRCHSWMSRHGSHLYKQMNKAWVHLFFTAEELASMGLKPDIVQRYYFPMNHQHDWFKNADLKIKSEDVIKGIVEEFFKKPEIKSRLPNAFKEFPEWQMSQSFNDYFLTL